MRVAGLQSRLDFAQKAWPGKNTTLTESSKKFTKAGA
jgi:hypothetical protein